MTIFLKITIILYLITSSVATANNQSSLTNLIQGNNFQGQIQLHGCMLRIDLIQFTKSTFYTKEISNSMIKQNAEHFMGFEDIQDLYNELSINKQMQISKDHSLIVHFKLAYKNKPFKLKLEIQLDPRIFQNQGKKIQTLLKLSERLSLQRQANRKHIPQLFEFKGDKSNINYKKFQVSTDGKTIKYLQNGFHFIFNHYDVLPTSGIVYFKVKIVNTSSNYIFLGICGKAITESVNPYGSADFIGLYLRDGVLYQSGRQIQAVAGLNVQEGQSIFKVQINMDKKWISWYMDDALLCTSAIQAHLIAKSIYPMITLYNSGDTLEFLSY